MKSAETLAITNDYYDTEIEYYSTNPLFLDATPEGTGRFHVDNGTEMWTEISKQ